MPKPAFQDALIFLRMIVITKRSYYKNIALPVDLVDRIDLVVDNSKLGYKSRGEVVKEAVRNFLKELR